MSSDEKQSHLPPSSSSSSNTVQDAIDPSAKEQPPGDGITATDDGGAALEAAQPEQPNPNAVPPPPNGGTLAWLQVLGGFFLTFNAWGITNTFGSYQAYYETNMLKSSSSSDIAWIGSVQAYLMLVTGTLAGPIYDAGYLRALLLVGSFMIVFGHMMLSLCHQYWQVLLSQAFCVGIGAGLVYVPSVAILSTYFTTRIGAAIGIAASGSSLGGVIYPIVLHRLLPRIGFGWATRVLGFMMLGTLIIPNIVLRIRVLPPQTRTLFDLRAFLNPSYSFITFGFLLGFAGLNAPLVFGQIFAISQKITNEDLGFYLIAILNSTSLFGRILPNLLSDKIGPFNVIIPCVLMSAILCILFLTVTTSTGIIVLMAFYGFFSGTFVSLPSTIIIYISGNTKHKIGTRLGQAFFFCAIGILIGTPIGGQIQKHKGYENLWIFGSCLLFACAAFILVAKFTWEGFKLKKTN
ncbi:major facilitator superfamily domain-containing protein [Bipolaris maydis]|nr:major facilitator superfamily domain-containing protein [Bipolaris maydis]